MSAAVEHEVERCGVCREWSPPVLHSYLTVWLPNDGRQEFGPYCDGCRKKAEAICRQKGWRFRVEER